jgi:anaerobic magnesium-protoporphyrin IX monomethyl ester cyclase
LKPLDQKKILLVHPLGYRKAAARRDISRLANIMPPLGLASIAAFLERHGMEAEIVDCYARPDSDRVIRDLLLDRRPAFLGLSCTTSSFLDGVRLGGLAKDVLPGIRVICGGPHASALKEMTLSPFPAIDMLVVGEGEQTLLDIMENEAEEEQALPGVVVRLLGGGAKASPARRPLVDLDSLPFPAYEKLDGYPGSYRLPIFNYPTVPSTSCLSSRGCPYACSYCDRSVFGPSYRYNSAEYLYEHLAYLKERFGIRHVNFYDDQFTYNRARVVEFTRKMADGPLGMTFNCAVRAEHVDDELLGLMKGAGCWMISLGIETGDGTLLALHRKRADLDGVAEKVRMISRNGIRTKGLFMVGLPGETEETIKRSIRYTLSLPLDDINVSIFTPFPGTPLYEQAHSLGEFDEDWEKMDCMHFQFVPKGMTKERMSELFRRFYRSHFTRPRVLWGYAAMAWRSPDSWLRFLGSLREFIRFARTNKRLGSDD